MFTNCLHFLILYFWGHFFHSCSSCFQTAKCSLAQTETTQRAGPCPGGRHVSAALRTLELHSDRISDIRRTKLGPLVLQPSVQLTADHSWNRTCFTWFLYRAAEPGRSRRTLDSQQTELLRQRSLTFTSAAILSTANPSTVSCRREKTKIRGGKPNLANSFSEIFPMSPWGESFPQVSNN